MNRKIVLPLAAFSVMTGYHNNIVAQPNILILLADDLGYGELGCYGQKLIATPVLDSLAGVGMKFTNFYAGSSVSSPSRAVLLTGISTGYNAIRGNQGYDKESDSWIRIPLKKDKKTLAEMLSEAGYQTGFIGKWHLGIPSDLSTWAYKRGFDYAVQEQWGKLGNRQFTEHIEYVNGLQDSIAYKLKDWECKDELRTAIAFDYIDKLEKDRPFFLMMSYRAPHAHELKINNDSLYADRGWPENERLHAAKITLLDKQIGRLLSKLDSKSLLDNTIVIFTSDNGPHREMGHDHNFFNSNGELRGYKRDMFNGGLNVPLIVHWRGKIGNGEVSNHTGCFNDIMPTLAQIANIKAPKQSDGISFLPELLGQEQIQKHQSLYWELWELWEGKYSWRRSALMDDYKAVQYGAEASVEIYDIKSDRSEQIKIENAKIRDKALKIFEEKREDSEHFPL